MGSLAFPVSRIFGQTKMTSGSPLPPNPSDEGPTDIRLVFEFLPCDLGEVGKDGNLREAIPSCESLRERFGDRQG